MLLALGRTSMLTLTLSLHFSQQLKRGDASRCRAYGPGLVEGIVDEPAPFTVENPSGRGQLEIKVRLKHTHIDDSIFCSFIYMLEIGL